MLICSNTIWKQGWWVTFLIFWLPNFRINSQVYGRPHLTILSGSWSPLLTCHMEAEIERRLLPHPLCWQGLDMWPGPGQSGSLPWILNQRLQRAVLVLENLLWWGWWQQQLLYPDFRVLTAAGSPFRPQPRLYHKLPRVLRPGQESG